MDRLAKENYSRKKKRQPKLPKIKVIFDRKNKFEIKTSSKSKETNRKRL